MIYADGKFNTTTDQSPANAARLYVLVSGEGAVSSASNDSTVVITNTLIPGSDYVLPETGGPGTILYTAAGVLMMSASGLLLSRKKRHRREDAES